MCDAMSRILCFSLGDWKKTPQSISIWSGAGCRGNESKKQSPRPLRYMRTRTESARLFLAAAAFLVAFFFAFLAAMGSSDRAMQEGEGLCVLITQGVAEIRRAQGCSHTPLEEGALTVYAPLTRYALPDGAMQLKRVEL